MITVRDRYSQKLSVGTASAFEGKPTLRSLQTRPVPTGVSALHSPELVCDLIFNIVLANISENYIYYSQKDITNIRILTSSGERRRATNEECTSILRPTQKMFTCSDPEQ